MVPLRVLVLDGDDCVLGAVAFEAETELEAEGETNAAVYSRAYRDIARIHAQAMQGAAAAQNAALELIREASRMRGEAERAAISAAKREGLLQAEVVRVRAQARHQRQLATVAAEGEGASDAAQDDLVAAVAEVLPQQLRPLLMQLLPELAREFGISLPK
jgi:hypothetical protein